MKCFWGGEGEVEQVYSQCAECLAIMRAGVTMIEVQPKADSPAPEIINGFIPTGRWITSPADAVESFFKGAGFPDHAIIPVLANRYAFVQRELFEKIKVRNTS